MQLSQLKFSRPLVIAAAITMTLLAHRAQAQTENIIYSFAGGTDGADPSGGLALDARGNLYGVAENGGANGAGMVFELSRSSGGTWTKSVLYSFSYVGDVYLPTSNLVFDAKG